MQQPVYRYNKETSCLEEQPRMERPHPIIDEAGTDYYEEKVHKYILHLEALKSIPTSYTEWGEKDLVEGRDFEIEWYNCTHVKDAQPNQRAVPLSPSRSQENDEDELWDEISIMADMLDGKKKMRAWEIIGRLQSQYKITKRI